MYALAADTVGVGLMVVLSSANDSIIITITIYSTTTAT